MGQKKRFCFRRIKYKKWNSHILTDMAVFDRKNKKVSQIDSLFHLSKNYSALIAPVGQTPSQAPQSMHSAALIS